MKVADADQEIASIHAILEPAYGHVEVYGQSYYGLIAGRIPAGPYSLEVVILPPPDTPGLLGTPREVRAAFLKHAEDALDALAAQGWQLMDRIRIEFAAEVQPFAQTLAGELVEPSTMYGVELKMRFKVDRPR